MKVEAHILRDFVKDIFVGVQCSEDEAECIADALVNSNLVGHDSHGVVRVPRYIREKLDGVVKSDVTARVLSETPVLAVIDGDRGFGQWVAPQAVEIGVRKCREVGLALTALQNVGHVGRVGEYAETAAAEGFVSIHFVNVKGSPLVAPFGGVDRRISTAPLCVGVPQPGGPPVILDFATSLVAEGQVLLASQGGKSIPPDALVGPDGTCSGDPHLLYGDYEEDGRRDYRNGKGAIRVFGEHKGYALAVVCELLGGSLTGGGATEPRPFITNGMLSIYIDPRRLDPGDFFPTDVRRYIEFLKSSRSTSQGGEVLFPGELEARRRAERLLDGLTLADDTWERIVAAARAVGVEPPRKLLRGSMRPPIMTF